MQLPTLYKLTKTGAVAWYDISVVEINPGSGDGQFGVKTEKASKIGGKSQTDIKPAKPKNVGKANETTSYNQAISEAKSVANKKKDEGYKETMPAEGEVFNTDSSGNVKPMLAHPYTEKKHGKGFPYLTQPKLDGMRCIAEWRDGKVTLTSRGGKPIEAPTHIIEQLETCLPQGMILDGELYCHKQLSFQEFISAAKKTNENTIKLEYHVYDLVDIKSTFLFRTRELRHQFQTNFDHNTTHVKFVKCTMVTNLEELKAIQADYTADGYEGTMLRNEDGLYTPGQRSNDLLKYKDFIDEEYEIIGVVEASGRDAGTGIFVCKGGAESNGKEFNARPRGNQALRTEYFVNKESYIGKQLTVRFQEYTDEKIPRFPVGIIVRDYE